MAFWSMDGGGGEPSENGSHNAAAPATPSKPNLIFKDFIENCRDYSFGELLKYADSGTMRFAVASPPPPAANPYDISVPNQLPYDLNLTPETNFGASSLLPNILNFVPVTPEKRTRSDNSALVETTCKENEKGSITTLENLAENPVNSLVGGNPENLDGQDIDMIKTPQQKQKRKKHRPKVIKEDKPKIPKTPKSVDSKERPTIKRTYVRRNRKENGPETPENAKTGPAMKKSCNRVLNFDGAEVGFNDLGSQSIPLSKGTEEGLKACPVIGNDSDSSSSVNLTEGMNQDKGSQGHYGHSVEEPKIGGINLQAYYLVSWPNSTRKRSAINMTNVLTSSATAKNGCESSRQMNGKIVIDISPNIRPTKKRTPNATKARDLASLNRILEKPKSCIDALKEETKAILARKRRTTKKSQSASKYPALYSDQPSYSTFSAERKMFSIDAIVEQLKCLDINKESSVFLYRNAIVPSSTSYEEHNALVLYKREGTVVPFEPIKKPRPRAKVDLDEETTRVWKLLLENINSEGVDGMDDDKAKYWEEERKVFSGRADSFIARMHLVQGDRRFSRWKGSVLDSVVGVFLTQNVSDHLSSSAYMSLAARFPLKSRNDENAQDQVPNNEETGTKETYESYTVEHCIEEEDKVALSVISQQQCGDSPTSQTCEKAGSCSENSDESALMLENVNTNKSDAPDFHEITVTSSKLDLKETCIESKASDNDDTSQSQSPDPLYGQHLCEKLNTKMSVTESFEILSENSGCDQSSVTVEITSQTTIENQITAIQESPTGNITLVESQTILTETSKHFEAEIQEKDTVLQENLPNSSENRQMVMKDDTEHGSSSTKESTENDATTSKPTRMLGRKDAKDTRDWDELKRKAEAKGKRERNANVMDSLDWEAVRLSPVGDIAKTIKERGMNNRLAQRIQDFLNRLVNEHGSTDLEWLRDVPPDQAKEYLLSIKGLGLKSVECVRLLTLHHLAFPVDTNVGRIAVRLGWVPLQPLPESLQLHLLEMYPVQESIQKYLWPRLCKLDQRTLYELHYQMITFGKVFCTKSKPNCNSCPLRGECRHFASAYASARLSLPGPEDKSIVIATERGKEDTNHTDMNEKTPLNLPLPLPLPYPTEESKQEQNSIAISRCDKCEPIIEEPASPEPQSIRDIEDYPYWDESNEIPTIKLNVEAFTENVQIYMQQNMDIQDASMSKALVPLDPEAASIPMPKLKNVNRLRTEHQVYELPDQHVLLDMLQMEKREPDDPSPYLLAIWTPGETANSVEPPEKRCCSQGLDKLCNDNECFSCNSVRETNSQTVRGTFLIPCRTAMRGSFPLNGTYFQVNEVFADEDTSINPMEIPRNLIWNLPRRTVYFGTSVTSIFRGLTTEGIQLCFWRGYVCVRAFDRQSRTPRPLRSRLHYTASREKRVREMKTDE